MPYCVYILRLRDGRLYVGSTSDLQRRLEEHRGGSGGKTTTDSPPIELVYSEWFPEHQSSLQRERQIKRWSRAKKLALATGAKAELKRLAECRSRSKATSRRSSSSATANS